MKRTRHSAFLIFFALVLMPAAPGWAQTATAFEQDCAKLASAKGDDAGRLHRLFNIAWDYSLRENPEMATEAGFPGFNDKWTDNSLEAIARRKRELAAPLRVLAAINRANLSAADQLNYDLFKRGFDLGLEGTRFKGEYLAVTQMDGVQQGVPETLEISPRNTVQDYENIIARLNAVPALVDQTIVLLQRGLAEGVTAPRVTLRDVPDQIKSQTVDDLEKNAVTKPFTEFPPQISETDRARLRGEAVAALHEKVVPAYSRLLEFMTNRYLSGARETIGMGDLPDGPAWYAFQARVETTTELTPPQIHEIGLSEVKRIRAEMDQVIAQTGFKGNLAQFADNIRGDARFFYTNKDDLLNAYRVQAKLVDPELSRLFGKLPRLQYGIVAVPAYAEKSQSSAYYQPGSPEAGRPGWFNVNTYALNMRPKWEMEVLAFHESVPGHHLQISLAQEMEEMPEFRKHASYTVFVEGWALYSEGLGGELGFYKDPYSKFGQLNFEVWRAIRLVVDTGLHSMHWTRRQAIDYFRENSAKTEQDIIVEVDRYIAWPGQALAYKMGQLKIRELRAYAARELGVKFDVREFHDRLLDGGALPLDVLEQRIKDWVAEKKGRK